MIDTSFLPSSKDEVGASSLVGLFHPMLHMCSVRKDASDPTYRSGAEFLVTSTIFPCSAPPSAWSMCFPIHDEVLQKGKGKGFLLLVIQRHNRSSSSLDPWVPAFHRLLLRLHLGLLLQPELAGPSPTFSFFTNQWKHPCFSKPFFCRQMVLYVEHPIQGFYLLSWFHCLDFFVLVFLLYCGIAVL